VDMGDQHGVVQSPPWMTGSAPTGKPMACSARSHYFW
jgi:hypothetical protein